MTLMMWTLPFTQVAERRISNIDGELVLSAQ